MSELLERLDRFLDQLVDRIVGHPVLTALAWLVAVAWLVFVLLLLLYR